MALDDALKGFAVTFRTMTRPTISACSGVAIPKPTQTGLVVTPRRVRSSATRSGGRAERTPVTPVSETR